MAEDCVFCKIVAGKIPSTRLHEDGETLAFADLNPQAKTHVLVIPKAHYASVLDLPPGSPVMARLTESALKVARQAGLSGFRLVVNTGADGGQTVGHLHLHLLGGRRMSWPPG